MNHSNDYFYIKCPYCHQQIASDSKFCPYCGAKQQQNNSNQEVQTNQSSQSIENKPFLSDNACERLRKPIGFIVFCFSAYFLFKIGFTYILFAYSKPLFIWKSLKYLIPMGILIGFYYYLKNRSDKATEAYLSKMSAIDSRYLKKIMASTSSTPINTQKKSNESYKEYHDRLREQQEKSQEAQQEQRRRDYNNRHIYKADTPFSVPMWHANKQEHHGWNQHGLF